MHRRHAPYAPLTPGKLHRRASILHSVKLDVVGTAVVASTCFAAAGLGFAAGRGLGLPTTVTASAGSLLPLILIGTFDRHRWRLMLAGYDWGGTLTEVSEVAAELASRGVAASVEVDDFDNVDDDERVSLHYRNADVGVVSAVLKEHGASVPRRP